MAGFYMSLPAASFEPVISYLNLASPGAEIRSGKTGNSASLRQSGHTTSQETRLRRMQWIWLWEGDLEANQPPPA